MSSNRSYPNPGLAAVPAILLALGMAYAYWAIGLAPVLIIGLPGIPAYFLWLTRYLPNPTDPALILPPFLLSVAGFELHSIEEALGHYGPTVGRIFGFAWTDAVFGMVSIGLCGVLTLAALGLYRRVPMAGFLALLFMATRLSELVLFLFPFFSPALAPDNAQPLTQEVHGTLVANMRSYYYPAVGRYYFPGMFSLVLTLLPAVWGLWRVWNGPSPK